MNTSPDQVFISYVRQDAEAANRLYNDLKKAGLNPWLDTKSLLPGQKWKIAIKNAIRNSRYFIALLSSNSVEKRGYVQKELKEALQILDEFPESQIFIIPVRLDDCNINDSRLNELHRVDLFPDWEQGIQEALRSLRLEENKSDKGRLSKKKEGERIFINSSGREARQEGASRRPELDIEQIRAELEKNPQNQVDLLRKMLSKINRDEVLSTTRTKDFIMFKLGELTHGEIGYNPNGVSVEPLD
jgi:hypothetical protein